MAACGSQPSAIGHGGRRPAVLLFALGFLHGSRNRRYGVDIRQPVDLAHTRSQVSIRRMDGQPRPDLAHARGRAFFCAPCEMRWKASAGTHGFFLQKQLAPGSQFSAIRTAPILRQNDGFSCRDAHAFNRNSSSQVAANVHAGVFSTCPERNLVRVFASLSLFPRSSVDRTLPIH